MTPTDPDTIERAVRLRQMTAEYVRSMTPQERVARGFALYSQIHEMLRVKLSTEFPSLSPEEVRKKIEYLIESNFNGRAIHQWLHVFQSEEKFQGF